MDKKLIEIDDEQINLNDIEHRILRPILNDPRIHYAVNCASIGCPNLLRSAYTGSTAGRMLEEAARAFINDKRGVNAQDKRATVSSIYAWFTVNFGGVVAGVIAHLKRYANPELASRLNEAVELDDAYDWALNDATQN